MVQERSKRWLWILGAPALGLTLAAGGVASAHDGPGRGNGEHGRYGDTGAGARGDGEHDRARDTGARGQRGAMEDGDGNGEMAAARTVSGTVTEMDLGEGKITIRDRQQQTHELRAHPRDLQRVRTGQQVTAVSAQFEDERWVQSLTTTQAAPARGDQRERGGNGEQER